MDTPGQGTAKPSALAIAVVVAMGSALAIALSSTYFGHSAGPYGNCFGRSGRPAPCEVVARTLTARDSAQLAQALRSAGR